MNSYRYKWNFASHTGLHVNVEVVASSAILARRMLQRFLQEQDGTAWLVESVNRSTGTASPEIPRQEA